MSNESPNELTFAGLQKFLLEVGFVRFSEVNNSLVFHHGETDTIIVLSIPQDGRTVRPADLLSVLTRLECEGLVGDEALGQFKMGKLPTLRSA